MTSKLLSYKNWLEAIRKHDMETAKNGISLYMKEDGEDFEAGQGLRFAACNGNIEVMQLLLPYYENSSIQIKNALRDAVVYDQEESFSVLLSKTNATSMDSVILEAIRYQKNEMLQALLEQQPETYDFQEAVAWAVARGSQEIHHILFQALAKAKQTQLLYPEWLEAIQNNEIDRVQQDMAWYAPLNDGEGLRIAARHGHREIIQLLLPQSNPVACGFALMQAAKTGQIQSLELLKPMVNAESWIYKATFLATENGQAEALKRLLPTAKIDNALLVAAAKRGYAECVEQLLPLSDANFHTALPLRMAANNGHVKCVELLLPATTEDEYRRSALDHAIHEKHKECIVLLWNNISTEQREIAKNIVKKEKKRFFFDSIGLNEPTEKTEHTENNEVKEKIPSRMEFHAKRKTF